MALTKLENNLKAKTEINEFHKLFSLGKLFSPISLLQPDSFECDVVIAHEQSIDNSLINKKNLNVFTTANHMISMFVPPSHEMSPIALAAYPRILIKW